MNTFVQLTEELDGILPTLRGEYIGKADIYRQGKTLKNPEVVGLQF